MIQKLISELEPGDDILSFLVLRKKEIKLKKSTNENFLSLEFGDKSGRIRGCIWKDVLEINKLLIPGDIVKVKGKIITYFDQNHISIEKIRKSVPDDNVNGDMFLPRSSQNLQDILSDLTNLLGEIKNPYLKSLNQTFLEDEDFMTSFCKAPGGKLWHHAYIGGLVEHTFSVMKIVKSLTSHYGKIVNSDITLSAAFFHDIGKIEELKTQGFIDYSTQGRLLGHIMLSSQLINGRINDIQGFPGSLKEQLIHCILSHHGTREKGSPVVPMTLEAVLLNYADELDSTVAAFQRIKAKENEPGREWSNYVNLIDRFIFLGDNDNHND